MPCMVCFLARSKGFPNHRTPTIFTEFFLPQFHNVYWTIKHLTRGPLPPHRPPRPHRRPASAGACRQPGPQQPVYAQEVPPQYPQPPRGRPSSGSVPLWTPRWGSRPQTLQCRSCPLNRPMLPPNISQRWSVAFLHTETWLPRPNRVSKSPWRGDDGPLLDHRLLT